MKDDKPLHSLLSRQLGHTNLSESTFPENLEQWQSFLNSINNSYIEADQDKYILERSSEMLSQEMMALNYRLKEVQKIAKIGYWNYELETDTTYYSDEFYTLFGLPSNMPPPTYKQILAMVYKEDKQMFAHDFEKSKNEFVIMENEFRLKTPTGPYRWYYLIFHPSFDENNKLKSITGIAMDINKRKQAEESVASLNHQLVYSARKAGMADVATSILHNVGNILNSANVGLTVIKDNLNESIIKKILSAFEMLRKNQENIPAYIENDPKGKLIIPYFLSIEEKLKTEFSDNCNEVNSLAMHLTHIREIVAMQQNISGKTTLIEPLSIKETIETAVKMSAHKLGNEIVEIEPLAEGVDTVPTDKSKILQILVNLIQNAKDAILSNPAAEDQRIKISVKKEGEHKIKILVTDTGIGIDAADKVKIFSFGFTKKETGHGYGLHASALFARELGGSLELESEGIGKGATFILSLPLDRHPSNNADSEKKMPL